MPGVLCQSGRLRRQIEQLFGRLGSLDTLEIATIAQAEQRLQFFLRPEN